MSEATNDDRLKKEYVWDSVIDVVSIVNRVNIILLLAITLAHINA